MPGSKEPIKYSDFGKVDVRDLKWWFNYLLMCRD